jgi:hypothetical protein
MTAMNGLINPANPLGKDRPCHIGNEQIFAHVIGEKILGDTIHTARNRIVHTLNLHKK